MKTKLILLACISITFTSCKKDKMQMLQPQSSTTSINEQVADLIKKADKDLYDRVYNQNSEREGIIKVNITSGSFQPQGGDIASGTCLPANTICHIEVVSNSNATAVGGDAGVPIGTVAVPATKVYTEEEEAHLIINTSSIPIMKNIDQLTTSLDVNGNVKFNYKAK